ncbi:hypothetical protein Droror1_Dr00020369 [Drosera rotundifolia]
MAAVTSVSFSVSTRNRAPSSSSTRVPASEWYGIRLRSGVSFGQAKCVRASSSSSSVEVVRCVSDGASAAVIDETAEASPSGSEFIDVGYLHDAHGLKGEISIKHATDFPEMRFSKPGKRWLRRKISGREDVQEVELVSGRIHSKHKSWIVKFDGIDNVDQAKQLIGATLLVQEHDRPMLEEGEFYSADLIGMQVILKETGKLVGTVVDVHNYGASDLLRVLLDSSLESARHKSEIAESDPVVWIPFVEAIVPDVDISKKEMYITPPKGLLELNLRSSQSSKKEKRASEWKERKSFQQRLIGAKKKLSVMEQQHVFHGLRFGEKPQRDLLAQVIRSLNSSLLQKAVESIGMPSERSNSIEFLNAVSTLESTCKLKVSEDCMVSAWKGKPDANSNLQERGLNLISEGKYAPVLVLTGGKQKVQPLAGLEDLDKLLSEQNNFVQAELRAGVPLIAISSKPDAQSVKELFLHHDHFGFDSEKVWLIEDERLPVVSSLSEEQKKHKILMKSPWEILQSPIGSSGILISLSSNDVLEHLAELGVEYLELCDVNNVSSFSNPLLLGFMNSHGADVAIQTMKGGPTLDKNFHMILSVQFLTKMLEHINKLQFHATLKRNSHVEFIDKNWIDVDPSSANSYEFESSIHSWLTAFASVKVSVVEVER